MDLEGQGFFKIDLVGELILGLELALELVVELAVELKEARREQLSLSLWSLKRAMARGFAGWKGP
jgi:hypothetical protein